MSPAKPVRARIEKPREKKREAKKPPDFNAGGGLRLASAVFAYSAHDPRDFRGPGAPEIAFAGRSNAGKSSAINALAGRKRLAFASKTPGRTQLINFFTIAETAFLVDLPGYGYAGVPMEVRDHWDQLVGNYVGTRPSLAGVIVVMDARHPLTPLDKRLLHWLLPSGRKVHVLLTKADKLSKQAQQRTLSAARRELMEVYPGATLQLFSSTKREGLSEAGAKISAWVADNKSPG
ncbi:ribosome biogenesis GTP-binding protein YihA/YsxC [Usitatibacter palustris]|uniref:Probable GTP-binding protein EngB n=1 Tax=Usitatibacter palustris TaxID=2732487 RepID=A0A6M4H2E8_9PROT|nr:ribosome biogenesis GTP-binding protein YihA/YsxC [Usitatibacter palustris]QJR13248.1 putative GTP-binding protein EngB [Usitatibacter palustris]